MLPFRLVRSSGDTRGASWGDTRGAGTFYDLPIRTGGLVEIGAGKEKFKRSKWAGGLSTSGRQVLITML